MLYLAFGKSKKVVLPSKLYFVVNIFHIKHETLSIKVDTKIANSSRNICQQMIQPDFLPSVVTLQEAQHMSQSAAVG